jgi:hypothetical protein
MDIHRILLNPDDGGWFVIGETSNEQEMVEFRKSLKRNAIVNTHIVNCTMNHENDDTANTEHKMKVQWTKCTSVLCHPKRHYDACGFYTTQKSCPVQLRMSTCQLTQTGVICQAYQHMSDEHDSAEPAQRCVTNDMKNRIIDMLCRDPDVKPMVIYKALVKMHQYGEFGEDLMPTKIQLRNALTYLRSRKFKFNKQKGRCDSLTSSCSPSTSPPSEETRMPE